MYIKEPEVSEPQTLCDITTYICNVFSDAGLRNISAYFYCLSIFDREIELIFG